MHKKRKAFYIFLPVLIICAIFVCAPTAHASADIEYYDGVTSCIAAVRGDENTLIASQKAVFEFGELLNKFDAKNAEEYRGKVTSSYELINPSENDDEFRFYLRCVETPGYFYGDGAPVPTQVTVDGERLEGKLRSSLVYWNEEEKEDLIDALNGDFDAKAYIAQDTPVYINSFKLVKARDTELTDYKAVMLTYDGELPVIAEEITTDERGDKIFVFLSVQEDETFTVASVGAPLDDIEWGVAEGVNGVLREDYEKYVKVRSVATEETVYRDYLQEKLGEDVSGDCFDDMYATVTAMIHGKETKAFYERRLFDEDYRIDWNEYIISVPAGGRASLCVTQSLFPDINENTVPASYIFSYYITDFNRAEGYVLTAEVRTPYYVVRSFRDMQQESYGYSASADNHYGLIHFTLSASADPKIKQTLDLTPLIAILLVIFMPLIMLFLISFSVTVVFGPPIVVLWLIVMLIRYIVRRRKRKDETF